MYDRSINREGSVVWSDALLARRSDGRQNIAKMGIESIDLIIYALLPAAGRAVRVKFSAFGVSHVKSGSERPKCE